jgi:hypothetical protein
MRESRKKATKRRLAELEAQHDHYLSLQRERYIHASLQEQVTRSNNLNSLAEREFRQWPRRNYPLVAAAIGDEHYIPLSLN